MAYAFLLLAKTVNCFSLYTTIVCLTAALLVSGSAYAQKSGPLVSIVQDSLTLSKEERFISVRFDFKNQSQYPVSQRLRLNLPAGWHMLQMPAKIELASGEQKRLSITLIPAPNILSQWAKFELKLSDEANTDSAAYAFFCKVLPISRSKVTVFTPSFELSGKERTLLIKTHLANTGNIADIYFIRCFNYNIGLLHEVKLRLLPGADTIYSFQYAIPSDKWRSLRQESISLRTTDGAGKLQVNTIRVSKASHQVKENTAAYKLFPLEVELGGMLADTRFNYFGVVKGRVNLPANQALSFSYKTRMLGANSQIQDNVLNLTFSSKRLNIYAGQMSEAKNFTAFGNGVKIEYAFDKMKLFFNANLHNTNFYFKNDQFEAGIKYKKGSYDLEHSLNVNLDPKAKTNSYILETKALFLNRSDRGVEVNTALGLDHSYQANPVTDRKGVSIGYSAYLQMQQLRFSSTMQHNDQNFPGVNRGMKNQLHSVTWRKNRYSVNLFVQNNKRPINLFRDTIFNSDVLSFNNQKIGVAGNIKMKNAGAQFGFGKYGQYGVASNSLDVYNYVEGSFFWQSGKLVKTSVSGFQAFGRIPGSAEQIKINNVSANIAIGRLTLSGFYSSAPRLENDSTGVKKFKAYDQTLNFTPAFGFSVAKRFFVNASYMVSKTLYDNNLATNLSSSLVYVGRNNHLSVSLSGNIPLTRSNVNAAGLRYNFFTLSVKKNVNIPLLFKRIHHNLTVVPFKDTNHNGKKDKEESGISGLDMTINKVLFKANDHGIVSYRNVPKGQYAIDLSSMKSNGLVPVGGSNKTVELSKSETVYLPFAEGCLLSGIIQVKLDSFSTVGFSPEGLKVIATDSLGTVYTTLADNNGKFSISLPAGKYVIGLNAEAFDDKIRPEVMSQSVDLTRQKSADVLFMIIQQKRKIRILKK